MSSSSPSTIETMEEYLAGDDFEMHLSQHFMKVVRGGGGSKITEKMVLGIVEGLITELPENLAKVIPPPDAQFIQDSLQDFDKADTGKTATWQLGGFFVVRCWSIHFNLVRFCCIHFLTPLASLLTLHSRIYTFPGVEETPVLVQTVLVKLALSVDTFSNLFGATPNLKE